jgi:hypothetical protein
MRIVCESENKLFGLCGQAINLYFVGMFLQRVWKHSRPLFFFMVLFIAAQLFVAYKRGMVFSPFYNYWMYASPYRNSDSLEVVSIYAGGQVIRGSSFNATQWDKMLGAYALASSSEGNRHLYGEISRIKGKFGGSWGPGPYLPDEAGYANGHYKMAWQALAAKVTGVKVDSVVVYIYRWDGTKLVKR